MNDRLPLEGVFPMHCSANVDDDGRVAIFFGLSGTGKTTLSADPERRLIGDDEHGWGDDGVFNFEGGCYAKVIRLSAEAEPEIYKTTRTLRHGARERRHRRARRARPRRRLEDREHARRLQARADRERAAGEAGRPSERRSSSSRPTRSAILPPIARLTRDQALFYFLSGFTAKLAGTEIGVTEPQPTFSACFGAPFLPQQPAVYARMLGEKLDEHGADRLARQHGLDGRAVRRGRADADRGDPRAPARRARAAGSTTSSTATDPIFGFEVPVEVPGVDSTPARPALDLARPRRLRRARRRELARMFRENFEQFADADEAVAAAGGPGV